MIKQVRETGVEESVAALFGVDVFDDCRYKYNGDTLCLYMILLEALY